MVTVSGPLSTIIAPPLPLGAELFGEGRAVDAVSAAAGVKVEKICSAATCGSGIRGVTGERRAADGKSAGRWRSNQRIAGGITQTAAARAGRIAGESRTRYRKTPACMQDATAAEGADDRLQSYRKSRSPSPTWCY